MKTSIATELQMRTKFRIIDASDILPPHLEIQTPKTTLVLMFQKDSIITQMIGALQELRTARHKAKENKEFEDISS